MKQTIVSLALSLVLYICLCGCSVYQAKSAVREQNALFSVTWNNQDTASFARFYHKDFVAAFGGKTIERTPYLLALKAEAARILRPISLHVKPTQLSVQGDTARAVMKETSRYWLRGKEGRLHEVKYKQVFESKWIRTGGAWQWVQLRFANPTSKIWINGKPATRKELSEL